jgi:predicted O-methyltransferase YrrM
MPEPYVGIQTVSDAELGLLLPLAERREVLELGSWLGWSTVELCKVATRVWSVDWHHDQLALTRRKGGPPVRFSDTDLDTLHQPEAGWTLPRFMRRTARAQFEGRLLVAVGRVEAVLPYLGPARFELIFHDADHTAEGVARDLRLALPLLTWDGWIAVHDYGRWGVKPGAESVLGPPDHVVQTLAVWGPALGRWHT